LLLLGHNVGATKARKPINGSEDAEFRLIQKETKICLLVWGPRARWHRPKKTKPIPIMTSPKNSNPKLPNCF